jgi:hypothetical protein
MSLLDKASLIVTPNAVKAGKLYSVIPNSGLGDLEVVRNTTATRVNELGLIENVAANVPRIDYADGECPSILVEPQSTNLVNYSEDLNNAAWSLNGVTKTQNAGISPDGLNNATLFSGAGGYSTNTYNGSNVLTHSRSIWAKTVSGTGTASLCAFNGNANSLFTITNEWQRFTLTGYSSTGGAFFYAVDFRAGNLSQILLWGAQAEVGSYATSYIPTLGSAVTRNADLIGSINIFTNELNTSGTWFLDQSSNESIGSTSIQYCLFSGDTQFVDGLIIEINSSGALSFRKFTNTVSGIRQVITNSNVARTKLIIRWNESTSIINIFLNGLLAHTFTGQTFVNYESLRFFDSNSSTITSISKVYSTMLFSTPLTDQECIELTTI